jgi:hypothetical protein
VLLRLVDDFLIISTSRAAAAAVGGKLLAGFPAFGVACNPAKTQANFVLSLPDGRELAPSVWASGDG